MAQKTIQGNSERRTENTKTRVIGTERQKKVFKIIAVGDSNVGKTCLTYRFCEGKFLDKSEATIGVDFRERTVDVGGEEIKLQLWDTAGQERFRKSMVQHYYRNVHAVVVVYDVTKASSFESLPQWIEECNRHSLTNDVPRILVGNKCDCKEKQAVKTNVAQRFADLHNMPVSIDQGQVSPVFQFHLVFNDNVENGLLPRGPYGLGNSVRDETLQLFETSARDESECDNVEAIFLTLAHKLKNHRPMMPPPTHALQGNGTSDALRRADVISITRESAASSSVSDDPATCSC